MCSEGSPSPRTICRVHRQRYETRHSPCDNTSMDSLAGVLLVAAPNLLDPNFFRSVVLILEHTEEGAVGVIINRPTTSPLGDELPEWEALLAQPEVVFVGGPVQPDNAVGLAEGVDGSSLAGVGIVDLSAPPGELTAPVRIYAGYAGWGPGQLEAELVEGGWIVALAEPEDVFAVEPGTLWRDVLRRQPGPTAMLATFPIDPGLN
ncbi:MAG: YqgE/AlgH family protein [Acidimicrobiia bacterium]|nr:YqgE/AlgH family protein [Acidimicrobiia bacterium]NNF89168.1 YqgE/AlgH family protein [Acidimicrobiia bacterium]NNL14911.1 YqgE/AlgH family protein [Acidimicrobiia bacterium]